MTLARYASTILHVRPRFAWRWLLLMRLASGIGLIVDGVMVLRAEPPLVPTLLHSLSAGLGLLLLAAYCGRRSSERSRRATRCRTPSFPDIPGVGSGAGFHAVRLRPGVIPSTVPSRP